jgi:hypothetical protein
MLPVARLKQLSAVVALAVTLPASAGVVDFDGTGAPEVFADTVALSAHYASLGLTFAGIGGSGGYILNQGAELGFMARSGTDFLAFNVEAGTGGEERISFASAQDTVSVHAATYEDGTFTMTAFDAAGTVLGFASLVASRDWQALTFNHAGIRSVVVTSTAGGWALDDLSFNASAVVPEPGSLALLGAGLLGLAALRRKY